MVIDRWPVYRCLASVGCGGLLRRLILRHRAHRPEASRRIVQVGSYHPLYAARTPIGSHACIRRRGAELLCVRGGEDVSSRSRHSAIAMSGTALAQAAAPGVGGDGCKLC